MQLKKAKVFRNGASQAVRLPAEFRFDAAEVYVSRDPETLDVTLSTRPGMAAWEDFFTLRDSIEIPDDWMVDRPMNRLPSKDRTGFGEAE